MSDLSTKPDYLAPCGICGEDVLRDGLLGFFKEYHDCKPVAGARLDEANNEIASLRVALAAAEKEIAALSPKAATGWIPCSERLPTGEHLSDTINIVPLQVFCPDTHLRIGWYHKAGFWRLEGSPSEWNVTHWTPLLAPPADRGEGGKK